MNCGPAFRSAVIAVLTTAYACELRAQEQQLISPDNMCGTLALACAARAAGVSVDVDRLVEELPLNGQVKSFAELEIAAKKLGLATRLLRWRRNQVPQASLPCIIRLLPRSSTTGPHFVTLVASVPGAVCLVDAPAAPVWVDEKELLREWDGVTLYVAPDDATLRGRVPSASIVGTWVWIALAVVAAFMLGMFGGNSKPKESKAELAGGFNRKMLALSAVGWALLACGFTRIIGPAEASSHKATITVDSTTQTIAASQSTLLATHGLVRGRFILTNRGLRGATIASVTPNCTCVSVEVSSKQIPPGESVTINVAVNLGQATSQEARLFVEMKDAIPQELVLRLTARQEAPR
jgi:hypothetical protein